MNLDDTARPEDMTVWRACQPDSSSVQSPLPPSARPTEKPPRTWAEAWVGAACWVLTGLIALWAVWLTAVALQLPWRVSGMRQALAKVDDRVVAIDHSTVDMVVELRSQQLALREAVAKLRDDAQVVRDRFTSISEHCPHEWGSWNDLGIRTCFWCGEAQRCGHNWYVAPSGHVRCRGCGKYTEEAPEPLFKAAPEVTPEEPLPAAREGKVAAASEFWPAFKRAFAPAFKTGFERGFAAAQAQRVRDSQELGREIARGLAHLARPAQPPRHPEMPDPLDGPRPAPEVPP